MASPIEAVGREQAAVHPWTRRARYFNSREAFALELPPVPGRTFLAERDRAFDPHAPTGLVAMDQSAALGTPFPATTPLALSRYARIRAGETLPLAVRASAQILCILEGEGSTCLAGEEVRWRAGDVLLLPGAARAEHAATHDAVAWLVTDEPALAFLDLDPVDPARAAVQPVHYPREAIAEQVEAVYAHPEAERFPGYAVVLSHQGLERTRNIHPTMTLALNTLPAGRSQRPHVHNSMALTLCLEGEGVHSMVDGQRKDWSRHAVMVTPPGAVHSHHNEGPRRMQSLVVQDGGLHGHARTMGFAYAD